MTPENQFNIPGITREVSPYGNGHINDTYLVVRQDGQKEIRFILQRMNRSIFKKPVELMENIVNVTDFVAKAVERAGGDPARETLNVIPALSGKAYHIDEDGEYWRMYRFIEESLCLEKAEKPEEFYESAVAFGRFQRMLNDFPAETLHETIPGFHDTTGRFCNLKHAVKQDVCNRADSVREEIDFVMAREGELSVLDEMRKKKELPLRVTHNDTKLNNVMMDEKTGKGICVIDLDTVMPGLSVHDFGDSIRFGASTAAEDEKDLAKVEMSLILYQSYLEGFLAGCQGSLTEMEQKNLPMGARIMTLECGMRFLTDYLEGDTYFKTHREGHNLDRARTQFKLVKDMEEKWKQMQEILASACGSSRTVLK